MDVLKKLINVQATNLFGTLTDFNQLDYGIKNSINVLNVKPLMPSTNPVELVLKPLVTLLIVNKPLKTENLVKFVELDKDIKTEIFINVLPLLILLILIIVKPTFIIK